MYDLMNKQKIMPNDYVLHKPTGKEWVVCGVNYEKGEIIPCGYPFPSIAKINDCELTKRNWEPQTKEQRNALKKYGMLDFIDVWAAMFDDDI